MWRACTHSLSTASHPHAPYHTLTTLISLPLSLTLKFSFPYLLESNGRSTTIVPLLRISGLLLVTYAAMPHGPWHAHQTQSQWMDHGTLRRFILTKAHERLHFCAMYAAFFSHSPLFAQSAHRTCWSGWCLSNGSWPDSCLHSPQLNRHE